MNKSAIGACVLIVLAIASVIASRIMLYRDDRASHVRLVSELPGIRVSFRDKKQLMSYLADFGFWDGVIFDYRTSSSGSSQVVPHELVVHVTTSEYPENRMAWTDGVTIGSTNLTVQSDNSIHLWIGIKPDYAKKYTTSVSPILEYFFVKTLAYRTVTRRVNGDTVTPVSFRGRKTYVFTAQNQ